MNNKIHIFNNEIEIGLRILIILNTVYPRSLDVELLNYYDYFSLHTADIGGEESLHPPVPNRFGELSVKREILQRSLEFLLLKGLINQSFTENGVEFIASETTSPFIDTLNEEYTLNLLEKAKWVSDKFKNYSPEKIRKYINVNQERWGSEISFCSIGCTNE
ncbi:MAG: ABC-three component system middle component 2 [Candidatus Electrothrix sp. GW3-4]|uniref:ABC-three component system middle component 2 n=1 Tax=Candidatus Electrothrix sp. GW3-4 TaxID=3126740 RepID=UPI0030D0CCBB